MILEYKFDYRSSSLVYEKIFLKQLKEYNLNGNILRNGFELNFFIEADNLEKLEEFANTFSKNLPHSIFLYNIEASMVENMPTKQYKLIEDKKLSLPPCPKCLNKIKDSYNIFTHCDICGYNSKGDNRNYQIEFIETAQKIKKGKIIEINTFYGKYFVGIPSSICNNIDFDILAYDLATVEKYTNIEEYELKALASFEKPAIRLKKRLNFTIDYEDITAELIRFRLPDDAILYLLMQELHNIDIDTIFISKNKIETNDILLLNKIEDELKPIEIVASPKHILIVKGDKGIPKLPISTENLNPQIDGFYSVIKEHNLYNKFKNMAGVNLCKDYANIIIQGEKFGLIEYLSFETSFKSIKDIFSQIELTDKQAKKLLYNYKNKFPEHYKKILEINFKDNYFSIYQLWGIIAIILDFIDTTNPAEGAKILEENAMSFLGDRGPRIDYKLISKNGKPHFDPLMTIRTAISFKLAGVDELGLSYGVVESFLEFITNELDELQQTMSIEAIIFTGSLLSNRRIFSKISQEVSKNHKIFFNNEIILSTYPKLIS